SNSIKYSDPAKSDCYVEVGRAPRSAGDLPEDAPASDSVTIIVRDNGIGIPDDDQAAIFDRFFRAHAHLDQQLGVSGTGLGLATVVDCVKARGGHIRCQSETSKGTSFFITLPLACA